MKGWKSADVARRDGVGQRLCRDRVEGKLNPAEAEAAATSCSCAGRTRRCRRAAAPHHHRWPPARRSTDDSRGSVADQRRADSTTQAQVGQLAQKRIEAAALARRVNAYGAQPTGCAGCRRQPDRGDRPAGAGRHPGGFDRYVAPEFSIGPRGFPTPMAA